MMNLHYSSEDVERGKTRFAIDGLNSIKYHILEMIERPMFTQIMVQFIPEEVSCNVRSTHLIITSYLIAAGERFETSF